MSVERDHRAVSEDRSQITATRSPHQHHAKWFEQFTTTQMGGIRSFDVYRSLSLLNRVLLGAGMFSSVAARLVQCFKQSRTLIQLPYMVVLPICSWCMLPETSRVQVLYLVYGFFGLHFKLHGEVLRIGVSPTETNATAFCC